MLGELLEGKLHEQFLWGGAGNGRGSSAPRQSLTRQLFFKALKQNLTVKTFVGTSENALRIQIWTALIALLLQKWLRSEVPPIYLNVPVPSGVVINVSECGAMPGPI